MCWTSTTPRNITTLRILLTTIPKLTAGSYGSICTWILGYPDRALRLSDEKDAHARWRGHPFDLGFALTMGAHEFDHRFTHEDLRKRAEECERLGRENSLPVLWALLAPMFIWPGTYSGRQEPPKELPRSRLVSAFGKRAAVRSSSRP